MQHTKERRGFIIHAARPTTGTQITIPCGVFDINDYQDISRIVDDLLEEHCSNNDDWFYGVASFPADQYLQADQYWRELIG